MLWYQSILLCTCDVLIFNPTLYLVSDIPSKHCFFFSILCSLLFEYDAPDKEEKMQRRAARFVEHLNNSSDSKRYRQTLTLTINNFTVSFKDSVFVCAFQFTVSNNFSAFVRNHLSSLSNFE